jgi:hypothetical protein
MPPVKYFDQMLVGKQVQANYAVLQKLFDDNLQQGFRDTLFAYPTEAALRAALIAEGIPVTGTLRIMLVDIEYARTKTYGPINAATEDFYLLVLPPVPRRQTSPGYKDMQTWEGAWHHAIVDSYGI